MVYIQALFLLLFPYAALKVSGSGRRGLVSPVLLCYATGILIGNLPFVPLDKGLSMTVSEISVPLAVPLILFSTDFFMWLKLAKKTVISFCLVIVSAFASAVLGSLIFSGYISEHWKVSSMLAGVYTGGTPNLMAIGMGLGISEDILVLVNTSDTIAGGLYLLFLIGPARWLLSKFLPPFKSSGETSYTQADYFPREGGEQLRFFKRMTGLIPAFGMALLSLGAGTGISMLLTGGLNIAPVMLVVTTCGIAASFLKRIRSIRGTYEAGQYIILIFSLAIGTTVNFNEILKASPTVFIFTLSVMTIAILVHFILAAIFRIDTDTTLITSTAGIYGPAFIGPVANAIKNREVIVSGLACGLVGYAVGNYLGFLAAFILGP